jgi:hypothetical protein
MMASTAAQSMCVLPPSAPPHTHTTRIYTAPSARQAMAPTVPHLAGNAKPVHTTPLPGPFPHLWRLAPQILRRLYASTFCVGPSAPVADLVAHVLRAPSPAVLRSKASPRTQPLAWHAALSTDERCPPAAGHPPGCRWPCRA